MSPYFPQGTAERVRLIGGEPYTHDALRSAWLGPRESFTFGSGGTGLNNIYLRGTGNNPLTADFGYLLNYNVRIIGATARWTTGVTSGDIRIRRGGSNVATLAHPGGTVAHFEDDALDAAFAGDTTIAGRMQAFLDTFNAGINQPTVVVWFRREEF